VTISIDDGIGLETLYNSFNTLENKWGDLFSKKKTVSQLKFLGFFSR